MFVQTDPCLFSVTRDGKFIPDGSRMNVLHPYYERYHKKLDIEVNIKNPNPFKPNPDKLYSITYLKNVMMQKMPLTMFKARFVTDLTALMEMVNDDCNLSIQRLGDKIFIQSFVVLDRKKNSKENEPNPSRVSNADILARLNAARLATPAADANAVVPFIPRAKPQAIQPSRPFSERVRILTESDNQQNWRQSTKSLSAAPEPVKDPDTWRKTPLSAERIRKWKFTIINHVAPPIVPDPENISHFGAFFKRIEVFNVFFVADLDAHSRNGSLVSVCPHLKELEKQDKLRFWLKDWLCGIKQTVVPHYLDTGKVYKVSTFQDNQYFGPTELDFTNMMKKITKKLAMIDQHVRQHPDIAKFRMFRGPITEDRYSIFAEDFEMGFKRALERDQPVR